MFENTAAARVAENVRAIAAAKLDEIDPKESNSEAARFHAYKHLLAFPITSRTIVVGTRCEPARWMSTSMKRVWNDVACQVAINAIDLAAERASVSGTIDANNDFAVRFTIESE